MHSDMESQTSSIISHERQLVVYLQLTSLSGEDYQVTVDLLEFDRFNEFETAGGASAFGCELTFVRQDTGQLRLQPVSDSRSSMLSVRRAQRPDEAECKSKTSACHQIWTGDPPCLHAFEQY